MPRRLDSLAQRCHRAPTWTTTSGADPPDIELAAYFVASEALANVAKYAQARDAAVRVGAARRRATLEIADDGIGGADPANGSGLRGLPDRVEALDGRFA